MSLLESYQLLVTSLKSYEPTKLTWEVVTTRLLDKKLMRRERGDGFDKGDVALVHTSQKNSSSKKSVRDKSQDLCNYYKKKGYWAKEC